MSSMDKIKEEACSERKPITWRNQSFIISLQLEYLTHKLRSIIYRNQTYAGVAADIAEKKRSKIMELSSKFHVDTIFTPGFDVSKFVEENFWQPNGLPLFQYKDEEQRRVQGNYDKWYILYRKTKVLYRGEEMEVICNNPSTQELKLRGRKGEFFVKYIEISLINNYQFV